MEGEQAEPEVPQEGEVKSDFVTPREDQGITDAPAVVEEPDPANIIPEPDQPAE